MKSNLGYVFVALIFVWLIIGASEGIINSFFTIPSSGVKASVGLAVYTDSQASVLCTSLDWGLVYPSVPVYRTVYLKNIGTAPLILSLSLSNLAPVGLQNSIVVSWNQAGNVTAGDVKPVTLSLLLLGNASDFAGFSFDIIITGTA